MKKIFKLAVVTFMIVGSPSITGGALAAENRPSPAQIALKNSSVSRPTTAISANTTTISAVNTEYNIDRGLTIAGSASLPQEHAVSFIKSSAPTAKLNCSVDKIVEHYYKEAEKEGIRGDVALAQALVETGFFKYGGSVNYKQNNFCGLGTTSSAVRGASFPTPEMGVRAHIQHLLVYSSKKNPSERIIDPRFDTVKRLPHLYATSQTWMELSGRWAADKGYGVKVLTVYARMTEHAEKNGYKAGKDKDKDNQKKDTPKPKKRDKRSFEDRIDDILRGK